MLVSANDRRQQPTAADEPDDDVTTTSGSYVMDMADNGCGDWRRSAAVDAVYEGVIV